MTGAQWQPGVRGVVWVRMDPRSKTLSPNSAVHKLLCTHNMHARSDTCGHAWACERSHINKAMCSNMCMFLFMIKGLSYFEGFSVFYYCILLLVLF